MQLKRIAYKTHLLQVEQKKMKGITSSVLHYANTATPHSTFFPQHPLSPLHLKLKGNEPDGDN